MTYGVEHLFTYSFAIYIYSLLKPLAHLLVEFFAFLLLSSKNSLYILDTSPLSNMFFANFIPQSVACLLILLTLHHLFSTV